MLKNIIQLITILLFFLLIISFQLDDAAFDKSLEVEKILIEVNDLEAKSQYDLAIEKVLQAKTIYIEQQQWAKAVKCLTQAAFLGESLPIPNIRQEQIYLKEATLLAEKYLPNNHIEVAKIQQYTGNIYIRLSEIDSAIYFLEKAVQLYDENKEWEEKAWTVFTIAIAYRIIDNYDKAEKYLLETEKIANTHSLTEEVHIAIDEELGAFYYKTVGDYEKAIKRIKKSLDFYLNKTSKSRDDSIFIVNNYGNLGVCYSAKRDYSRAVYYSKMSLALTKKLRLTTVEIGKTAVSYSVNLFLLGKTALSMKTLKEVLQIKELNQEREKRLFLDAYFYLAENYKSIGNIDSALYFYTQCINLSNNYIATKALILAADLYHEKGENEKAINMLHKASLFEPNTKLQSYLNQYNQYNISGKIYTATSEFEKGLQYYQKAIAINDQTFEDTLNLYALPEGNTPFRIDDLRATLQMKAFTLKAINTPESLQAAFETNQLAIHWAEKMRQDFAFEETKVNLNKNTSDLYKSAIEIAYELYNLTNDKKYLEEAFVIAEKQKGILLLESLIDEKGQQHYKVPRNLLEREAQLKSDIAFYKQEMLEHKGKEEAKYELYSNYHNSKNIEFGNLKDSLKTYYKSYFDAEYQRSIASIEKIQNDLLQPKQAFVQYMATDSLFYVFAIEKENQHFLALPKETTNLKELQGFLHSTNTVKENTLTTFKTFTTLAHQSYQQILEPVTNLLSEGINELIIVPDDALNYLPFETLLSTVVASESVDFLGLPYLIHDYQFHYGYSGTLLLENQKQYNNFKGNAKLLAYAPPYKKEKINTEEAILTEETLGPIVMRDKVRSNTIPLENTAKEIAKISKYFDGKIDSTEHASKINFQQEAKNYGLLHLAMHGSPNLNEPDYAHLVFSNIKNDSTNLLYHYEITSLETNAQLAVLSACETGVGKALAGEGVMSLGRAFMYAGVPSVVMSLWQMNDKSTSELMPLFYKYLKAGMRKDKALHQAKIDYLNNSTSETAYPFYWAGFVSLGDAQPIKEATKNNNWIWWIGGLVLLLLIVGVIWTNKKKNK